MRAGSHVSSGCADSRIRAVGSGLSASSCLTYHPSSSFTCWRSAPHEAVRNKKLISNRLMNLLPALLEESRTRSQVFAADRLIQLDPDAGFVGKFQVAVLVQRAVPLDQILPVRFSE